MMVKRFVIIIVFGILMMSCGAVVSTLLKVNTGEAKRLAKKVINENSVDLDLENFDISNDFKNYLASDEGRTYFENIRLENGKLEKIKLKGIKGSTSDTMNYRFISDFSKEQDQKEVRVQAYKDKEIISIVVAPWEDIMKPIK